MIRVIFMMLQVFLDHVVCHMARTEGGITNSPKMFSLVPFPKLRKLFLDFPGAFPFHETDHIANRKLGRI